MNILTIDIGGSSIKYGKFTKEGELISKGSFDVPTTFEGLIEAITEKYNSDDYNAIAVSSPGAIDSVTGAMYGITAIDYLPGNGNNIKQALEAKLDIPVAIENDANCAGLSEVHFSNGLNSIAYIVLGSGVGGCMIIDGKVNTGANFFGGEFGYIPYKDSTFSGYAGMNGLSKRATNQEQSVPGIEIFEKYEQGEASYVSAVNEYYTAIAHLISILKYYQDPQAFIFAGAVTNRSQFISEVKEKLDVLTRSVNDITLDDVNVQISQFGSDANLYGAYANLVRNYEL